MYNAEKTFLSDVPGFIWFTSKNKTNCPLLCKYRNTMQQRNKIATTRYQSCYQNDIRNEKLLTPLKCLYRCLKVKSLCSSEIFENHKYIARLWHSSIMSSNPGLLKLWIWETDNCHAFK